MFISTYVRSNHSPLDLFYKTAKRPLSKKAPLISPDIQIPEYLGIKKPKFAHTFYICSDIFCTSNAILYIGDLYILERKSHFLPTESRRYQESIVKIEHTEIY
jgi:hypothetical protein